MQGVVQGGVAPPVGQAQCQVAGPEDTILAGTEAELEKAVRRFADAGATELQLCPAGPPAERERTIELFGELAGALG